MTTRILKISLLATSVALLGACTTLVPNYQRPAAPVSDSWPTAAADSGTVAAQLSWQTFIADDRLRQLVALALDNNRDLRVAALNIEKARAQYRIQTAELFPAVGVGVAGSHSRISAATWPT